MSYPRSQILMTTTEPANSSIIEKWKPKPLDQAVAMLPILLVFISGFLGEVVGGPVGAGLAGGLAAFAYVTSLRIFRKKEIPQMKKYVLSLLITFAAFVAYAAIIAGLGLAFPDIFKNK